MKTITSTLSPIYASKINTKVFNDSISKALLDILQDQKITLKACHIFSAAASNRKKLVFSEDEIKFIVEEYDLLREIYNSEKAMQIFKEVSGSESWTMAQISMNTKLPPKTVYDWIERFRVHGLIIDIDKKPGTGNAKFHSLNWKYKNLILVLRAYMLEKLSAKKEKDTVEV